MLSDLTTLVVGYVFYTICFLIIIIRLAATWAREKKWRHDDYWMLGALAVLVVRTVVVHLVLVWDTNNIEEWARSGLQEQEVERREMGSKMALVARTCYAAFIWSMKACMLAMYSRIVQLLEGYRKYIKYMWVFLFLTFAAVMVSTLLECRPFNHYWQVIPNPGKACTFAEAQLYTTGACNIATDLVLILYPLPMIFHTSLPQKRKIQLYILFSLGFFVILVSIFRLPFVMENNAIQRWRTLFASIEMLVACCVANAPVMYRLIKAQAAKHTKASADSVSHDRASPYWFSVNRSARRQTSEIDGIEIRGLGLVLEDEEEEGIQSSSRGSQEVERKQQVYSVSLLSEIPIGRDLGSSTT
ncbi:hypothetical protein DFP73DRAFT_551362 [Morchella snyderi]|nr:hypothetical protein DFP73DRAFT_551362 [Morchella snyderi]